jgi:cytoskeleton protein RodZ
METLPTLFKQLREKKGISLADAQAATRIPLRYLEVLEGQAERRRLADYAYLVPFVRTYATFLGVDPTTAVSRFITELQGIESQEIKLEHSPLPSHSSSWVIPFLCLGGLLLVFVYLWQRDEVGLWEPWQTTTESHLSPSPAIEDGSPVTRTTDSATSTTAPAVSPPVKTPTDPFLPSPLVSSGRTRIPVVPEQPEPASPLQASQPAEESAPQPVPSASPHLLRIEATEQAWIRVRIDNQQQKDVLLKPGEKIEWTAKEGFLLTFGNAGGVTLNLNGKDLPPLGKSGQVLRNVQLPTAG